ncbi:hypothetical protein AAKU55_002980 [Oxalobacteraceae bacterium GrIS 1.11]
MEQSDYMQLVRRLEVDSAIHPAAFRAKLLVISYGIYLALFITLAGVGSLLWYCYDSVQAQRSVWAFARFGLATLFMLPLFYVVLRTFFMRLPAPQGRFITAKEAPRLFDSLATMREKLKGPRIHHVLIDGEYNASIAQRARFGLFGASTNYLTLGLPYMLGVSSTEMLATVAHEYGHLCGNHGALGAWVYRQRRTMGALHKQARETAGASVVHGALAYALAHFMPYYNAYTFVLSRQNEYEADRIATEMVGAAANARGLVRDALLACWIREQFWPTLYRQANLAMRPSFLPFSAMRTAFKASHGEWATPERLSAAWLEKPNLHDTHPALRQRVEATGETPVLPPCVEVAAAETLLGVRTSKRLIDEFDTQWWEKESKPWEARCRYALRSRERLAQLAALPLRQVALLDLQELALLKEEFDSPQAAKPVLEHLLRQPGGPFPKAAFIYGRILLGEGNERGFDHLAAAAAQDRSLVGEVAHIGYDYWQERQDPNAARFWWERFIEGDEE